MEGKINIEYTEKEAFNLFLRLSTPVSLSEISNKDSTYWKLARALKLENYITEFSPTLYEVSQDHTQ